MAGRTEANIERKPLGDAEEVLKRCGELEAELNELKAQYDQYFLGMERVPPTKHHERLKKQILELKGTFVRQTAAKFRVQQLAQKLATYERLWDRTIKEIEAGTYSRDLFKARLHRKAREDREKKRGADDDFHIDEDLDLSDLDGEDGDLESVMAAAAEAVSKPAPKPIAPAVKPVTGEIPMVKPVTGGVPMVKPVTGDRPVVKPVTGDRPMVKPVTGDVPRVKPVTGDVPTVKPVTGGVPMVKPVTGDRPMVKPVTGDVPMVKPATGSIPKITAAGPPGGTGSNPALKPANTGSNPAFKPGTGSRPAPVAAEGGLSDQKIKAIYDAYVMAKKRCGEDTRNVTLDSVSATLRKQVPELMKQHSAKSVEFKVVIKDGKAVLRALPKE